MNVAVDRACASCGHSAMAHASIGIGTCAAGRRKTWWVFWWTDKTCSCIRFRF